MKTSRFLAAAALATLPMTGHGYEGMHVDAAMEQCYGYAMVGMDSVINSRLGVAPEDALMLARHGHPPTLTREHYSIHLLTVMWDAYLWDGPPHEYAVQVFYRCAAESGATQRTAGNDM